MFKTTSRKKLVIGLVLFAVILSLFLSFNRLPKLDTVGGDLDAITAPDIQCFQGFCIERDPGTSFLTQWWIFTVTYLRLVTIGMTFAFLVAGLTEAFLFPSGSGKWFTSGGLFKRTIKGMAVGPVMNLCSACIVPISAAFRRRGLGIEGTIAMVQGSATMNIPALAMVFFVFTPMLGFSRLILALAGALLIGPLIVIAVTRGKEETLPELDKEPIEVIEVPESSWKPALVEGFRDWAKFSLGYLIRMGPIMILAGAASGLAIQWISPETISDYLGNGITGVIIAATLGVMINVPLLFEIPLVALLLMLGMGTAPAATLLFTAAAGGPMTFWGLAKVMPRRAIAAFATATWTLGVLGGLVILGLGIFIWDQGDGGLRIAADANAIGDIQSNHDERPADSNDRSTTGTSNGGTSDNVGYDGGMGDEFMDVTRSAGVTLQHQLITTDILDFGAGVIVFDYDNDGYDDFYVTNSKGANALYRNLGDETFEDVAGISGVADSLSVANGGCAADYDNDGNKDLFVTNYGVSKLFRNHGEGQFEDVTDNTFIESGGFHRSMGCAWGDYDKDGFVDLVIVRHMNTEGAMDWGPHVFGDLVDHLVLYHNNGDGYFDDVTTLLGDPSTLRKSMPVGNIWGAGFQPAWIDFDNDGDLDLYVVNDFGYQLQPNVLWRNDGLLVDGSWGFVDVSVKTNADIGLNGMGLAIGDYNLDGFFDFYVTNIDVNYLLKYDSERNLFKDVTVSSNSDLSGGSRSRVFWGTMFFDYDNDGDEDLYVVAGYLKQENFDNPREQRNVLLRNDGDGKFSDVSKNSGADDLGIGRGAAFLDFNSDGCLDIVVHNLSQMPRLLQNLCNSDNAWIKVKLRGSNSNMDAIGARIEIIANNIRQIREISAGSSQMSQNMLEAHFGLGKVKTIDSLTIRWPSGNIDVMKDVEVNQSLVIVEYD